MFFRLDCLFLFVCVDDKDKIKDRQTCVSFASMICFISQILKPLYTCSFPVSVSTRVMLILPPVQIGSVLKKLFEDSVVKREELFITSKLWYVEFI